MLTDYILTVAVSISAGVAAITSAIPELREHRVGLGLALIGLITLANLRGLKEAGTIFAAPTYLYILSLGGLVLYGLFRSFTGSLDCPHPRPHPAVPGIRRHYDRVVDRLSVPPGWRPARLSHTVVVLVGGVHRGVLEALAYAKSLNPDHLVAVTVVSDEDEQERIEKAWARHDLSDPLDIIYSPYRELSRPILRFLDEIDTRWANDVVTVLIPEVVVRRWWEQLLHNQSALFLKGRLLFRKGLVVTSVPYHLD